MMASPRESFDLAEDRSEAQYFLATERVPEVAAALSKQLPSCRYPALRPTIAPSPTQQSVTTVYLDTPTRSLYREGLEGKKELRLRVRRYSGSSDGLLWFEIKQKLGTRTAKRRLGIPPGEALRFFGSGISEELVNARRPAYLEDASEILEMISLICRRYQSFFRADAVVTVQRLAWQDEQRGIRVTLDRELTFFSPGPDLWNPARGLARVHLGEPVGINLQCVLEVKSAAHPPKWVTDLLDSAGARDVAFSKFTEASRAVHGGRC